MRRYMDPYDSEEMRPGPDCDEAPGAMVAMAVAGANKSRNHSLRMEWAALRAAIAKAEA